MKHFIRFILGLCCLLVLLLAAQAIQKSQFRFYVGETTGVTVFSGDYVFFLQARWTDGYMIKEDGREVPIYFQSPTNYVEGRRIVPAIDCKRYNVKMALQNRIRFSNSDDHAGR